MDFSPAPTEIMSRDMIQLKRATNGKHGEINAGGVKVFALRLADNLYVTTEKVPASVKTIAQMERGDIHELKNPGDMGQFLERYRAFRGK